MHGCLPCVVDPDMAARTSTRVAVVTGANRGIGLEIVRQLCKIFNGEVVLTARDESSGKEVVRTLESQGLKPRFHQLDVTDQTSISALASFLSKQYGGLDVLVNNAGIMFKSSSTLTFKEQVTETMNINFWGALNVSKALFPLLRPHARVVNVSSMLGSSALNKCAKEVKTRFTSPDIEMEELEVLMRKFQSDVAAGSHSSIWPETAYGVSKIGVTTMSIIQQKDADKKQTDIVVNACCPGWVRTDLGGPTAHRSIEEGADTPVFLATLPEDVTSPRGELVSSRKIKPWTKT